MAPDDGEPTYYVISDLHIGGDEQLGKVEFLDELIGFLAEIPDRAEDVELIINGDTFGLWEITEGTPTEKFEHLRSTYPDLFDQFRRTGERIPITLVPGNHDHGLAAHDVYVERFEAYNVDVVRSQSIERWIDDHRIHFEHGHQQDPNNRFEAFGNPHEKPLGYYYNTLVTSRAGRLSDRGRFNWLKDLQAVTPTERVPNWLISKYFYREMHPMLRYAAVPFLFLFNISVLVALLAGLDLIGVLSMPIAFGQSLADRFGRAGSTMYLLLTINVAIAGLIALIALPLGLFVRDVRTTLDRFGIMETDLTVNPETPYRHAARDVFAAEPATVIFCYGHTHRPKVVAEGDRLLVNTGTWLKRFHRRDVIAGRLPPVFYPSFQLSAVRIEKEGTDIVVDFEPIEKPSPKTEELTRTERLLTLGREPRPRLPARSMIGPERTVADGEVVES